MKYYIAIDAGTSVIKTVIFNTNFRQLNSYTVKNPVVTDKFGKSEIEMEKFWLLNDHQVKIRKRFMNFFLIIALVCVGYSWL